jgi:feruloyl esterase
MAEGLKDGYAVTGNDTGHMGESRAWMGDAAMVGEWGHSATHLATVPAKAIVTAFYGAPARYAYFTGCSTGGAQAMEEAEFYPGDYDGIVAGAPGMAYAHLMLSFLWGLKTASAHPDGVIPQDKLRRLHQAVLDDCGDAEERARGVLDNPLACRFDPARLACKAGDAPDCLTPGQVATAEALYQGPRNPRTGAQIYPGFARGSEFDASAASPLAGGWGGIQGPLAQIFAIPLLKDMAYHDPHWDWRTFDWDKDVDDLERRLSAEIEATNPDLSGLRAHGGKLIVYQGWMDPLNAQTLPVQYRAAVIARFARDQHLGRKAATAEVDAMLRLFMVPGMGHCGGGPGPSKLDALTAMRAWVEDGRAPDRLTATGLADGRPIARPICAYPAVAHRTGACVAPIHSSLAD